MRSSARQSGPHHPLGSCDSLAAGRETLVLRLATAIIGVPILFAMVWLGELWTLALAIAVVTLGLAEFYSLVSIKSLWARLLGIALGVALVTGAGFQAQIWAPPILFIGLMLVFVSYRFLPAQRRSWPLFAGGPFYLGAALAYAVLLRGIEDGALWLSLALAATFVVDTSAYFAGKAFGKHRMAPGISPGKTWEGAAAGLLGGILAFLVIASLLSLGLAAWKAALLGIAVGLGAQAGDLLESALKRANSAKQSGRLVPGHGGVLDRLDSIVLNLALVYYGATWVATW